MRPTHTIRKIMQDHSYNQGWLTQSFQAQTHIDAHDGTETLPLQLSPIFTLSSPSARHVIHHFSLGV